MSSICFVYVKFISFATEKDVGETEIRRLPTTVKPTVYDLYFIPDLKAFKFDGKETVSLQVGSTIPFLTPRF